MKKLFLSSILMVLVCALYAQTRTVKGTVIDDQKSPLPGVSVIVKGTTTGTITDFDGAFQCELDNANQQTLVFSYIGFHSQEVAVGNSTNFNVVLKEDVERLDEVVVVGYGVQKKALVTGANLSVKGEDIANLRSTSAMEALQGIAPGVSVTRNSGSPGAGTKISIRGLGSTGDAEPLYIVDGVSVGSVDYLSPSDIESINVLKDAASAAIYGARAANGVVLVTTRMAKKGQSTRVTYDGYLGIQNIYKKPSPLNAQEYMLIMDERRTNDGLAPNNWENMIVNGNATLDTYYGSNVGTEYGQHVWDKIQGGWTGTNWIDEIAKKDAAIQSHSFNITGSNEGFRYAAGLSYLDQEGIIGSHVTDAGYKRLTARFNSEMILYKNDKHDIVTLGENFTYTNTDSRNVAEGDMYWNDFHDALVANPLTPLRYENGALKKMTNGWGPTLEGISDHQHNPVGRMYYRNNYRWGKSNNITGNVYLVVEPIKDLKFRSSFGLTTWFGNSRSWTPTYRLGSKYMNETDEVSQSAYIYTQHTWSNTISYDFRIKDHKIGVMLGSEMIKTELDFSMSGSQKNTLYGLPKFAYLNNVKGATTVSDITLSGRDYAAQGGGLMSYMGRFSYNYKEKYMVDFTMRADGSSVFSKQNRWGYFPSISAGWNFSEEEFMVDVEWLTFGKLRASWGQNGNNSIPGFTYLSEISSLDRSYYFGDDKVTAADGTEPYRVPNPDIKWETSEQLNIGLDMRFLDSRLGLTFDWYTKTTKDWLVEAPVLGTYGLRAPYINGGNVKNSGFEMSLSWNERLQDFAYGATLSGSYNKNEVTKLANAEGYIIGSSNVLAQGTSYVSRVEVGKPIGFFYGYQTDGILQNQKEVDAYVTADGTPIRVGTELDTPRRPGDLRFVDQNGDGIIDDADKVMLGKPQPDFEMGLQLNAEYKGFYFNTTLTGKFGMQVMQSYRTYIDQRENYTTDIFNRWHGEGTSNKIPRLSNGATANFSYVSDMYMQDADYVRISNLTVGYRFDKLLKSVPFIHAASVYMSVNNLYTFAGYDGMNPEVGYGGGSDWASGIDLGLYPLPRTVLFGFSATF